MAGVRKKKSRRKATIKITKGARKKPRVIKPSIGNKLLHEHWDNTKTLQQNMSHLGLSYDSNKTVKISKRKIIRRKDILRQNLLFESNETMEVDNSDQPVNTAVIEGFEKLACKRDQPSERHIAPGEAKFLMDLIHKHGNNYKKMERDKLNTHQHTRKQLQRKCEALLRSSLLEKYKNMYPGLLPNGDTMET